MPPARRFAVLTCMDARLDPARFAGLAEGDAHVIRNAGGRASDDAIRSLVISYKLLGTREWFVIHHTDCGMETFSDEIMRELLAHSLETATIDAGGWRDVGTGPGSREAEFIDWLTIPGERGRGRAADSRPSAGAGDDPDLRLHLRCAKRPARRGRRGQRRRQGQGRGLSRAVGRDRRSCRIAGGDRSLPERSHQKRSRR
jgi:hypothetical protein